jgi:hypothetical protein
LLEVILGILAVIALLYLAVALFVGKQLGEAQKYLQSGDKVDFQHNQYLVFKPKDQVIKTGFVFYPGGFVDAEAYGRVAAYLARHGVLSVIVTTPMRLAWFNKNQANKVMSAFPEVPGWFIGGHSLGGVVAAFYLKNELEKVENGIIKGVVLLGAFLTQRHKLEKVDLPVLSIYGSKDGMAKRFEATRYNVSQNTTLHRIEGGNHGQFGYYGKHFMYDHPAAISRDEQQSITEKRVLKFINRVLEAR